MAWGKLWLIAYRDLLRNRRRSFFSALAVALGLALLMIMNGLIAGVMDDSLQNSIRLQTGHLQIRAASYVVEKMSLQWKDLLPDPEALAARARGMSQVKAAAPVLWTSGILNTADESAGLQIYGIDPTSALYDPIRQGLVGGEFLAPDDRGGILIGQHLADSLGLAVGQDVDLAIVNSEGQPDEGIFTIRGLYSTGVPAYDESTVFLPLSKAQAFTRTEGHASAIVVLLHNQEDAAKVASALQSPSTTTLTWRDLNALALDTVQVSMTFYYLLDGIVMLIVGVVIANTLLMAVFERIREMGILAALGMKGWQIRLMFLFEAAILALAGIVAGLVLGSGGVMYLVKIGIAIGDLGTVAGGFALGTTMYAHYVPSTFAALSIWTLALVLAASLYPAWFASRLQPVEALHSL
jgi:ABC-type lipoprotein release transport system permease subunit